MINSNNEPFKSNASLPPVQSLVIENLKFKALVGCTDSEGKVPQDIELKVELRYLRSPEGALSDSIKDVDCYVELSEMLRSHCESKHFQLIEKLATDCYQLLFHHLCGKAQIKISVYKVKPPGFLGKATYICGDFL